MNFPSTRVEHSTFETAQPWVVYHYGTTVDTFRPPWRSTRILGFAIIVAECAVCGEVERLRFEIPRWGPIVEPEGGRHAVRVAFLERHTHPDRGAPMSWVKPLLNMAAHPGGLSLEALAMRLEADLNQDAADG